jgi:hypothetical protein
MNGHECFSFDVEEFRSSGVAGVADDSFIPSKP